MARKRTGKTPDQETNAPEVWEGDWRRSSVVLAEPGEPEVAPDLIVWADATHAVVVGMQTALPGAPPRAMAESLQQAMAQPGPGAGPPRRPSAVRVGSRELAEAIRPVAEPLGIAVEAVEALPLLDIIFRDIEGQMGNPDNQGYLQMTDIPEPVLADLFAAAADYYRAKPWKRLSDADTILLECHAWKPAHRYAVIMGAGGETFGFALYESWAGLQRLRRPDIGFTSPEEQAIREEAVSLTFEPLKDLGPRRREEAKRHGWTVASYRAYPMVMTTGRRRQSWWPDEADARVLIAAARALTPGVRDLLRPRWMHKDTKCIYEVYNVPVVGEEVEVKATFPAESAPKPRG
ncbi:MAG: hypothetical protein HY321_19415 [Armatimonadetes bacterium]|nr:hypothetical protein [Armatimonadota bacterium]